MKLSLFALPFALPFASGCVLNPPDVGCLLAGSSYAVLGTTLSRSIDSHEDSIGNYSIQLAVNCVLAMGKTQKDDRWSQAILNQTLTVGEFGDPNSIGSTGTVGATQIHLIHIKSKLAVNQSVTDAIWALSDPCLGPLTPSDDVYQQLSNAIAAGDGSKVTLFQEKCPNLPVPIIKPNDLNNAGMSLKPSALLLLFGLLL